MPLETRHLRLLKAIVEEGSVTRAAHRLHVTQPALSHQLRRAEDDLGARLFERVNKKMVLTAAGGRLLHSAQNVLAELDRVEQEIRRAGSGEGRLRISTECYTCYHWLPPRLKLFERRYPGVDVQIVAEATRQPLQALLQGQIDLGIVADPAPHRRLEFWPLFEDELVVIVAPQHPLAARAWMAPADFTDQHLILYAIPPRESCVLQQILRPASIEPRKVSHVELTEAILEMVRAGLGIAVFARWAVAPMVAAGRLKALRLTRWGFRRKWFAAARRSGTRPDYLNAFVGLLRQHPIPNDFARPRTARGAEPSPLLCTL